MSFCWTMDCTRWRAGRLHPLDWETAGHFVALGREMKVVLVFVIVVIAAATAFAYGQAGVGAGVTAVAAQAWAEPAALLLSGSALLGIAGAVRRLPP